MSFDNEAGTAPERIDIGGMAPEERVSFSDVADTVGGAWPKGWYSATILEGYATGNGHTFLTEDKLSKAGNSRNLVICFALDGGKLMPGQSHNTFKQFNYRVEDFTPTRVQEVIAARKAFAGAGKGKWIGNEDLQRSSIFMGKFGQLEEALGFRIPLHPMGHVNPTILAAQKIDVYLGMDKEDKYNEVNGFAKAGTKAKR